DPVFVASLGVFMGVVEFEQSGTAVFLRCLRCWADGLAVVGGFCCWPEVGAGAGFGLWLDIVWACDAGVLPES
ncbi:MAG: hypothetical protein WBX08_03760, partial [Candidatus Sulfotelmatobacter sp.]